MLYDVAVVSLHLDRFFFVLFLLLLRFCIKKIKKKKDWKNQIKKETIMEITEIDYLNIDEFDFKEKYPFIIYVKIINLITKHSIIFF